MNKKSPKIATSEDWNAQPKRSRDYLMDQSRRILAADPTPTNSVTGQKKKPKPSEISQIDEQ